ncbi:T7SS effector LXG polymorphic toxin [Sporosarcina sp. FSL K6-6792]|uniref:T7SS effector LXG polymorphic toxin n=1 Tax=Sporosarcina sp. FSL K6-6792 TaxID=2921559 RepID=UPI0030F6EBAF
MLDRLSSEMEAIHHAVEGLVEMEEQFKGAGGNAIRSFYQECHLPFLHFFKLFSEQFKQVLHQMEGALHSLEPDSTGYILEPFLEGELEQGLTLIGRLTASLTDEANSIMDQVSDIVGLPHLDDSGVQEGVIRSKRKREDTVSQLYEFDATQTSALNPIEQELQTMNTWLTDMEGLFQAGVKDINFVPSQWNVLTFRSDIRTELFPKVYLDPSDLWIKEQEQLIGTMITAATFQTLEGKKVNTVEENLDENIKYHVYENGLLIKEYAIGQSVFYEVVSKVEYKAKEIVQADTTKESNGLDRFQTVLDIAGLVPVFGEVADGINGIIYAARGDALNATLSLGAMIPFAGWASTGTKLAVKGNNLNQVRNVVSTEKMESIYSPIYKDVVNSSLGKTQNQLDLLTNTHYQLGTPNALAFNMPFPKTDIPTSIKGGDVDVKVEVKNVDVGAKGTGNGKLLDNLPRIKEIEVNFNRNVKHDSEEFTRQLRDQEKGMNELRMDEYLTNRERYIAEGRAIEGNVAQQTAREEALSDKIFEFMADEKSFDEAEKEAKEWLNTQAALHNPDQIAGGKPDKIGGMGHKGINSSIGSQWRYRIDVVDEQIREMAKNMTPEQIKNTYLNVKLKN